MQSRTPTSRPPKLDIDLNTTFRSALLQGREQVGNVIPWVSVKTSAQSLLVKVVGNQTDAAPENEETVQNSHPHVVLNLLAREGTAVAHEINEADSDTAVDVEDQVVLLGGGDSLDGNGVIQQLGAGEVLLGVLLDKLDTEVRVVTGLDSVPDTRNYCR